MNKWLLVLFLVFLAGCTRQSCDNIYQVSDWSECNISGYQTQTIIGISCEDNSTIVSTEYFTRECTPLDNVVTYTEWTNCNASGLQSRIKTVSNYYDDLDFNTSVEYRTCTIPCFTNWVCTVWSECNSNNLQSRTCYDSSNCGTIDNKPFESQECSFVNPCDSISDSVTKAECNSLIYRDFSYCNSISDSDMKQSCYYTFSQMFENFESCNYINDSIIRNTCKAIVELDKDYCNILAPSYRDDCYINVDLRYSHLASINLDNDYCDNIEDEEIKSRCLSSSNYNYYSTYKDSISSCSDYSYVSFSTYYQMARTCYVYHFTQNKTSSICDKAPNWELNECNALISQNLSYCYDQTGSDRDFCLGSFAYYNDDSSICREASNEDNCLYVLGYWFRETSYCYDIQDSTKRNYCISSYVSFCESNVNNCPTLDYCDLLTNSESKNDCIYRMVKNQIEYKDKVW